MSFKEILALIRTNRSSDMSAGQPQAPEEAAIQTQLLEKGRENIHPAVSRLIRFTDEVELGGPNTAADPKTSAKY